MPMIPIVNPTKWIVRPVIPYLRTLATTLLDSMYELCTKIIDIRSAHVRSGAFARRCCNAKKESLHGFQEGYSVGNVEAIGEPVADSERVFRVHELRSHRRSVAILQVKGSSYAVVHAPDLLDASVDVGDIGGPDFTFDYDRVVVVRTIRGTHENKGGSNLPARTSIPAHTQKNL